MAKKKMRLDEIQEALAPHAPPGTLVPITTLGDGFYEVEVPVDTVAEALGLADRLDAALTGRGIEEMPVVHPLLVEWLSDADAALELVRKGDVIQASELAGLVRRARALLG